MSMLKESGVPAVDAGPVYPMPPTIARALEGPEKIIAIIGPVGTSKTTSVCMYVMAHGQKYAAQYPGETIRWVFVRDTYESIRGTTLKTWLGLFPSPRYGVWNEAKKQYTVRTPRGRHVEVLFMGIDDEKDISKLLSLDLSGAVVEEIAGGLGEGGQVQLGIPEFVYKGLIPRVRHPIRLQRTRLIIVGNPPSKTHWSYRVFRPDLAQPHEGRLCVNVPPEEAPILREKPEYYAEIEQHLGVGSLDARRYCDGEWLPALSGGFHRDMIPIVPRGELPPFAAVGVTVDPAAGGKSGVGDRTAIAVAGFARGTAYLVELVVGRLPEHDVLAHLFRITTQYTPVCVAIEAVGFQTWLMTMIEQERRILTLEGQPAPWIPTRPLPRDTRIKKETRIQGTLGVRLASRRLAIAEGCQNLTLLYEELESFPEGQHDDILDALADLNQIEPVQAVDVAGPDAERTRRQSTRPADGGGRRGTVRFWGRGVAA